jgi:hypothetical protein
MNSVSELAPIFTNTEYLYRETGWERLEERRTRRKLQLFYNIQNSSTPNRNSRKMHCSEAVLKLYSGF